ncbi:MAG TPA: type II toxin-antitoxin system RelE/ParE family toxin [Alphaproteobacteria bacterium]|nr:type II toxin-antitoxin system RelE/ParE family toxin [Alphaproteobacteria bacterium]
MAWTVAFAEEFVGEVQAMEKEVRRELLARARLLAIAGPQLGRPHVDTLNGSDYPNMKELRFMAGGGVWRAAFAFDPKRHAILLVAGDKSGTSQARFYKRLIAKADARYKAHLERMGS